MKSQTIIIYYKTAELSEYIYQDILAALFWTWNFLEISQYELFNGIFGYI